MERSLISGFREESYVVSWNPSSRQLERMYELRADVFCRELGWVTPSRPLEMDEHDRAAVHIVISNESAESIAAVRLLPYDAQWMLDTVFRNLVRASAIRKHQDVMEVSRLVVARQMRNTRLRNGKRLSDLLYKAVYVYCQLHAIRYLYMVTSNVVHRHLKVVGVPCEAIAHPQRFNDGVVALAAKLDWARLDRNAKLLGWYESISPTESRHVRRNELAPSGDVHPLCAHAISDASVADARDPRSHSVSSARVLRCAS